MRRLTRFWNALDALPGAASDRRDWRERLGDEWTSVAPLLRRTGRLADAIACPVPGGEGCPRRVVHHPDGCIRAVCGERPTVCDSLELNKDDIAVLALDRTKLAKVLAEALAITGTPAITASEPVVFLGRHDVYAGRGIPIFLVLPDPVWQEPNEPFRAIAAANGPKLVLTPTMHSLGPAQQRDLDELGATRLALDDVLAADAGHRVVGARSANDLLAPLRAAIEADAAARLSQRAWDLPPDAKWEEMTFEFTAAEVVHVRFRGETRRFGPEQLGMKRKNTRKPTSQWSLLQSLAAGNGRLSWQDPDADAKLKKQKQLLSERLRDAFGIAEDPIPWRNEAYVTRFVIRGDVLGRGRPGQRRR